MFRLTTFLLLFGFFFISPLSNINAQVDCNPALDVLPGMNCNVAPFVCDLNGYCSDMQPGNWGNNALFCNGNFSLQNPNWFAFVANSTVIDIDIALSNCQGGNQTAQWALYNNCNNLLNALDCNGGGVGSGGVIEIYYTNAVPGTIYYVVLDGSSGATCHYEVSVTSGIGTTLVSPLTDNAINGALDVCVGATVNYSFAGFGFATNYEWILPNGVILNTTGPSVTVNYSNLAPGNYELCVHGTNECDEEGQDYCWDITVAPDPTLTFTGDICQGQTFQFRGANYPVGTYNFTSNGPTGTSCDTAITLTVNGIPPIHNNIPQQVFVCSDYPYALIDGVQYSSGPNANEVSYVSGQTGCDSLVKYYVNAIEAVGNITALPASLPCGGTASSTLTLVTNFNFPPLTSSVEWFNALDVSIGTGTSVNINNPGFYYAIISYYQENVFPFADVSPLQLNCTELFFITVTAENSTLTEPIASGPAVLCAGQSYQFTTNTQAGTTSYTWKNIDGTVVSGGTSETITLSYATPGTYEICVNAVDGCGPGPEECFQVEVVPSPTVSLDANYAVCAFDDELTGTIGGVANTGDPLLQYLWTVTSGPDIAGVVFAPANAPVTQVTVLQPGTYTFQLEADYNGQQCGDSKTIEVTFERKLELTANDMEVCNDLLQPLPSIIDLDTLLTGNGIAYTGSWTFVGGPGGTPGGTLPQQDFTGLSATGVYTYEFTPVQSGVCDVDPIQVELDLQNCICPPLSINPTGGTLCNDSDDLNLNTLILGGTGSGSWLVTTSPGGATASVAGGVVDFSGQPSGSYLFTFTLDSPMAGCPSTATTTVDLIAAPEATLRTAAQACNSNFSPEYVNLVDFDSLVTSGINTGVWTYSGPGVDPGSASFHPKDFNGATAGSYQYTYTIMGDPSCDAVSYTINVIIEDCKCPSVAISPAESFCNSSPQINLDNYKVTTKAGAWTIQSGPAGSTASIIGGNLFNGTGSAFGDYVLVYTLDVPAPDGCSDTSQLILKLDSAAFAGNNEILGLCDDFGSMVDLDTVLTLQQSGGSWVYTGSADIGSSFNPVNGTINFNSLPQGLGYTFNYTVASPLGLCPGSTSTVTVNKNPLPVADAGLDGFIDCVTQSINLGGNNTSSGNEFIYTWSLAGNEVGNSATLSNVIDAGVYELEVTNSLTGCVESDVAEITKDNAAISAINYAVDSISCFNKADGAISIVNITGGTPAFEYSIDGGAYSSTGDFNNLGPGIHTIEVTDINGCHYEQVISLENPKEVRIELGTNKVIAEGDAVTLSPDITIDVNAGTIVWTSNPAGTSCNNCETLTESPLFTTTYIATVTNDNGCSATDSIEVRVRSVIRVFLPNAISPNNDGVNDVFYVQSDHNVVSVKSLAIYNRWGDVQFSITDTPPNDPAYGWNGRFGEQRQNTPSVFVYHALLQLRDGREVVYKGDVTVIK